MLHVGWPQGIYIGMVCVALLVSAAADGKPRTGEHKFALSFVSYLLMFGLLYWGGFFS